MPSNAPTTAHDSLHQRLASLPIPARRLLCVIARQARHGSLRSKPPEVATMPEVHESCGLGVDELRELLQILAAARFVAIDGAYPYEEMRLTGESPSESATLEALIGRC